MDVANLWFLFRFHFLSKSKCWMACTCNILGEGQVEVIAFSRTGFDSFNWVNSVDLEFQLMLGSLALQ